jgi:site-specific recombinase XerD
MKNKPNGFLELLEGFLYVYLPCSVGVSANTVKSYKDAFRLLLGYMHEEKHINADEVAFTDLDYKTMLDFLSWLETERGSSISTRNQRLSALSSFAEYAQNRNFDAATIFRRDTKKLPSKKCPGRARAVFTLEETAFFLNLPKGDSAAGFRNKTLLSVMYASGARAQEICDLTVYDCKFHSDAAYLTLAGKGGKIRRVGIPKGCAALLKQYIDKRGLMEKNECHVFSSQTHEHMTVSCIEEIYKKYVNLAKEEYPELFREKCYTPHSMRHTTATHMLEAGVPIVVIKNFLGHASLQSTQIYAEVTQSTLDMHIKAWNEKWGPKPDCNADKSEPRSSMPDFLMNKSN